MYKQEGTGQVFHLNTDQEYNAHPVKNSDKAAAKKHNTNNRLKAAACAGAA